MQCAKSIRVEGVFYWQWRVSFVKVVVFHKQESAQQHQNPDLQNIQIDHSILCASKADE
jgi:hypothetical protein